MCQLAGSFKAQSPAKARALIRCDMFLMMTMRIKIKTKLSSLQVEELDPFETVVTMRRQRMKMVQKPMQYNYMFRCLADYVAETTSDYV